MNRNFPDRRSFKPLRLTRLFTCIGLLAALTHGLPARAQLSADVASRSLKDLNAHFPFEVPATLDDWSERAERLRLQMKVALGIHPQPDLGSTEPKIYGRIDLDGYSIEKIHFESFPGLYVTASLYRPSGSLSSGNRHPAVVYAHGHWDNGRFYEASEQEIKSLLATGAERFKSAAANHFQAACVQLARMGCVVMQVDMLGYADSLQISYDRAHRYGNATVNPEQDGPDWLLYSARAEGLGQSVMGLQIIHCLRAFEVLKALPDVDGDRLAITGASGGGTQSFIASAVEPTISGAFPAVMVSTGMQGGCTCENACGLRIGTGNVEIAALTAPRPLAMTTAQDWTATMPKDGFPELKKLYDLYKQSGRVSLHHHPQFPHNFNHVSRVALYGFMNRLFKLGHPEPILERDFERLGKEPLTVWDDAHPQPGGGLAFESKLLEQWGQRIDQSLQLAASDDEETRKRKVEWLREGWTSLTAHANDMAKQFKVISTSEGVSLLDERMLPSTTSRITLQPGQKAMTAPKTIEVLLGQADAQKVENKGANENAIYRCEFVDPFGGPLEAQPLVANPRPAASYTYGYNAPRIIRKLSVAMRLVSELHRQKNAPIRLVVVPEDLFHAAAIALHMPKGSIEEITVLGPADQAINLFAQVDSITHNHFLPNSLRYQDVGGLLKTIDVKVNFSVSKI
jgi:dienelactone hydrolase